MTSLFISSGEVSGDLYAARIVESLRRKGFDAPIWGMGGDAPQKAGAEILWSGQTLQLMGLVEVFSSIPHLFARLRHIVNAVCERAPRAVVVIDSPDFHMPLIARLRKKGYRGRIFYVSPPSVWAWRSGRTKALARDADVLLPLFEFEHDYLLGRGCASLWQGSPLLDEFPANPPYPTAEQERVVALLPGSRRSEVRTLFPVLEPVYKDLEVRGYEPVFSLAPGLNKEASRELKRHLDSKALRYDEGLGRDLMSRAGAIVGASGTATIEALLLRRFMVVLYRINPISAAIARCVLRNDRFAMANLVAGEDLFPEYIQASRMSERAHDAIFSWLESPREEKNRMYARFERAVAKMGRPGVYDFWTEQILRGMES